MDPDRPFRITLRPQPSHPGIAARTWNRPANLWSRILPSLLAGTLFLGATPSSPLPQATGVAPASSPGAENLTPPDPPPNPSAEAIDSLPYRIQVHLAIEPSSRIDLSVRQRIVRQWRELVRRFIGSPWVLEVADRPSPLAASDLSSLQPESMAEFDPGFDKIWLICVRSKGSSSRLQLSGREFDAATRRMGPLQEQELTVAADAPRALLKLSTELFNPTALITGQEGGRALMVVRGSSLPPASDLGRVVEPGRVFFPLRLVRLQDDSIRILRIPFTYLEVESVSGPIARCAIISALRDPLSQRIARPSSLAAVGTRPGKSTLPLRFVTRPQSEPAAGYTLVARPLPDGPPRELGMTDRSGRILLQPGFADGLVILRLIAGAAEPMVEFPIMPGESGEERVIPFDPKPLTVGYQVALDTLRDEVIDLVALRARLEKRMEARLEGDDLEGLEAALKEYALLPPRDLYADRLARLKDEASRKQEETKSPILTKTLQAQFTELEALIQRYLDDEPFIAFTEALERKRAEDAERRQSKTNQKRSVASSSPAAAAAARSTDQTPPETANSRSPAPDRESEVEDEPF